jgi:hypothetical protein
VIEGYATAGGFEIMVNSDFAIMEENAKMGDFHMRRALFGGAGPMYRLPRILGERKAKELMHTGKLLSGKEAYEWGLVNAWAPAEVLDACVDNFVADLTDKSPFQMSITKMAVNRGLDADTETLMLIERLAVGVTLNSRTRRKAVNAFLNKARARGRAREVATAARPAAGHRRARARPPRAKARAAPRREPPRSRHRVVAGRRDRVAELSSGGVPAPGGSRLNRLSNMLLALSRRRVVEAPARSGRRRARGGPTSSPVKEVRERVDEDAAPFPADGVAEVDASRRGSSTRRSS